MSASSELKLETGDEGYLLDPTLWSEAVDEHGVAPSGRDVTAFMKVQGASRNRLFELFPYGYVQQTCKIAGMKKPRSWSTG